MLAGSSSQSTTAAPHQSPTLCTIDYPAFFPKGTVIINQHAYIVSMSSSKKRARILAPALGT